MNRAELLYNFSMAAWRLAVVNEYSAPSIAQAAAIGTLQAWENRLQWEEYDV